MADVKTAEVLCDCPFCGRSVSVGRDANGQADSVLHGLPTCEKFDQLQPDDFVTAIREELERQQPN